MLWVVHAELSSYCHHEVNHVWHAPFLPGCQWCKFLHHFEDGVYLLAGDILAGVGVEVVINYEVNPRIGLCTRMILTGMISVLW